MPKTIQRLPVFVEELLDVPEHEIGAHVHGDTARATEAFGEVCTRIQNSHLYGGQPRGPAFAQNVALARLGKALAAISGDERLQLEAACLMARVLNAGEAYAESLPWYDQAIRSEERRVGKEGR